ncbi:MAG: adenylosuccinate synthetase, partial [Actinomycetes bacterium]
LPGWDEDISHAKTFEDLPINARKYVEYLEKISGAPMSAIGVGQHRDATISRRDLIN